MGKFILGILFSITASAAVSTSDRALVERGNNLLVNGGFESGKASWSASAGTFATTTTAANVGKGSVAATWNAAASGNTLTSSAVAIPAGLYGRNGVASCLIQGASATHTLQAYDGTNILASTTINSQSGYSRTSVNFIYPSSGNIQLRLYANADEPSIAIDDCFLGDADGYNISQISQAVAVGQWTMLENASCTFSITQTTYAADYSADSDCNTPSVTGSLSNSLGKVLQVSYPNAPTGTLKVSFIGKAITAGAVNAQCRIVDDLGNQLAEVGISNSSSPMPLYGMQEYTTAGNRTFKLQCKSSSGAIIIDNSTATGAAQFTVERFPTSSEIAFRPSQANAWGVGKYSGVTNCSWSTTSGSYADLGADSDCNSKTVSGSASDVGDSEPEFNFNNLPAGTYKVTATGLFQATYTSSSTECLFRLYDGTNQIGVIGANAFSGSTTGYASNINGYVTYSTQSSPKIRVQGFRTTGGGSCVISNTSSSSDFQIILEPVSNVTPFPALVGSVTSNSSGQERVERVSVTSVCSSTPCTIARQSGSWLSSISRSSTGTYSANFAAGAFSEAPSCVCSVSTTTNICDNVSSTTSAATFTTRGTGGSLADATFNLICMGPK